MKRGSCFGNYTSSFPTRYIWFFRLPVPDKVFEVWQLYKKKSPCCVWDWFVAAMQSISFSYTLLSATLLLLFWSSYLNTWHDMTWYIIIVAETMLLLLVFIFHFFFIMGLHFTFGEVEVWSSSPYAVHVGFGCC